jgi:hypothetical protein
MSRLQQLCGCDKDAANAAMPLWTARLAAFCSSHAAMGQGLPPNAFEQQSAIKQPICVSEKT